MKHLRKYFFSGLIAFLPVVLTCYLFIRIVKGADDLLGQFISPYLSELFGFHVYGVGIVVGILLIVLIGFFVTNFLGQKIYQFFEKIFLRLPLIRMVYSAIKELASFLFTPRNQMSQYQQVVLVQYPRKGIYSIGFLTSKSSSRISNKTGHELYNVVVPGAPNPITGVIILVPRKEIIFTDIKVEEAVKFIISGGVVNPEVL
ncbi:MAG: DUF502 domain-containing protein [Candidatus Omnitrophica bacterium]|nr:DUF502 domain-containing protein [Candidatus Omnitrophota bacterium]